MHRTVNVKPSSRITPSTTATGAFECATLPVAVVMAAEVAARSFHTVVRTFSLPARAQPATPEPQSLHSGTDGRIAPAGAPESATLEIEGALKRELKTTPTPAVTSQAKAPEAPANGTPSGIRYISSGEAPGDQAQVAHSP